MEECNKPYLFRYNNIYCNKPNWILHPFKRYRYNKWIKNLTIASDLLENYEYLDKLAILTDYNINNMEYVIIYSRDGSGDFLRFRSKYVITPYSHFDNPKIVENFKDVVLNHHNP